MLILQVLKNFVDSDLEAALEIVRSQSALWAKLRSTYSDVRDVQGFYKISLDQSSSTMNNDNKLMYLDNNQWRPPPDFRSYLTTMFKSKSCDQIKRGMGDLEAKFEEKGAPALIPFDQLLLSLLQNDDPTVVKRAFTFLLEIIRAEPKNIWDYYNRMLESLKGKMINSDIVTEFVILAMPKGKENFEGSSGCS